MKAELLAPACSPEGMRAAIAAGADAVYIGGKMFGARAYAGNPDTEELLQAVDFAHLHGRKLYLTVNTLLKNKELKEQLYDYLAPCYERGIDAVIVQDLGVLSFIRQEFPGLPIHASTQMAITGKYGAELMKEAGASRIVTARELSLEEIRNIHRETGMEIESFIHGALCYCYSGMCLFSSVLGGRSGNRGRCAQPCRLPYEVYEKGKRLNRKNEEYPLSPKDMCTIELLPEILEAGVYSLKIEGRMKKPEYAAGVTRIYRKYLDLYEADPKGYQVAREDMEELMELYQRDGFNQGYYNSHNGRDMIAVHNIKSQESGKGTARKRNEDLFSQLKVQYVDKKLQEKVYGNLILFCGSPAILDLESGGYHIQVQGEVVEKAKNQPLSEERVRIQMEKTGNTPFFFEELQIQTDEKGFIPMQSLNDLRRRGLERLKEELLKPGQRTLKERTLQTESSRHSGKRENLKFYVSVETWEQMEAAAACEGIDGIYFSMSMVWGNALVQKACKAAEYIRSTGKESYLALPYILREDVLDKKKEEILTISRSLDGFLVRNLESLGYLKSLGLESKAVCDFHVYAFNDKSSTFLREQGVLRTTVPVELNAGEIRLRENTDSELIIYGYYPMMVSAQCPKKTFGTCDGQSNVTELKDRYNQHFLTKSVCEFCYTIIYNSVPAGLLKEAEQIKKTSVSAVRMNFTTEGKNETEKMLHLFLDVYRKNKSIPQSLPSFTKGHFKRGVE